MSGSRSLARTLLLPLLALGVVYAVLVLKPGRDEGTASNRPEPAPVPEPAGFEFLRPVVERVPPEPVLRHGPLEDPVERWCERALDAPLDERNRALDRLVGLRDPDDVERFLSRVETEWRRDPLRGYVFLPVLARLEDPRAASILEEAATHSSNMVRDNAARALGIRDDAAAVARLEKMLSDPYEAVRTGAIRELIAMKCPDALDALQRYAEQDPEERMKHVLFRLGEETENPETIPLLQKHFGAGGPTGVVAMRMLAKFGDPSALDVLYKRLEHGALDEVYSALLYLLDAPRELVDVRKAARQLENPNGEVRRISGELILRLGESGVVSTADADWLIPQLERRLTDLDYRARAAALAALNALGRVDVLEPYRKSILTATGAALHEAVEVTTVWCKDPSATRLVLDRLGDRTAALTTNDRSRLIRALGETADPAAIPLLVEYLRQAAPDEPRDGDGVPLSTRAALHIVTLGPPVERPLLDLVRDATATPFARMRACDALRGVEGASCWRELLAVYADPSVPREVRRAAVDTLVYFASADYHDELVETAEGVEDRELRLTGLYLAMNHG